MRILWPCRSSTSLKMYWTHQKQFTTKECKVPTKEYNDQILIFEDEFGMMFLIRFRTE